jgi:hypothetical protein
VPFHEVYAMRAQESQSAGLQQLSYIACVSQARNQSTGELGHVHWCTYTEDPAAVPGKCEIRIDGVPTPRGSTEICLISPRRIDVDASLP